MRELGEGFEDELYAFCYPDLLAAKFSEEAEAPESVKAAVVLERARLWGDDENDEGEPPRT